MDNKFELGVNQALVIVFALGLLVGFGGGVIAPYSLQDSQEQQTDTENSDKNTLEGIDLEDEPSLGSSEAKIKVIEYSDYGCPWCAEWAGVDVTRRSNVDQQEVLEKIKENYISNGDVEFIYKDFPIRRSHPNAENAHVAANCAYSQSEESYWDYHDALFERRDEWTKRGQDKPAGTFESIAQNTGLNMEQFSQCVENPNLEEINEDRQKISKKHRIGTPTFFIGNREVGFTKISGAQPYQRFERMIKQKMG